MTNAQDRIYGSQGGDYGILEMSGSPGNEEFGGAIGVGISGGSDSSGATAVNTATKTVTATNAATMGASTTAAAVVATTSGKPSKGDRLFSGLGKVAAGLVGTVLYYVL